MAGEIPCILEEGAHNEVIGWFSNWELNGEIKVCLDLVSEKGDDGFGMQSFLIAREASDLRSFHSEKRGRFIRYSISLFW